MTLLDCAPETEQEIAPTYTHLVTLIHRSSEDEISFEVHTPSGRPVDVFREIAHQRSERKLFGYEIFELIDLGEAPF